jgi:uncharacterized protein (DUF58 family)
MLATSALLAHTTDLNLIIRHVLAGLGHGIHAGRERGAGVEFSEYRAYAPGDEWRRVDWKLLARADRYYVREAERDSHVAVWLWLDASASMAEASKDTTGLTKLWFARTVLACMAAIAQRQGDAFGLIVCTDGKMQFTPAARGPRQLHRILALLARATAAGGLPDSDAVKSSLHFARSPSLVFAVSDFLDWPSAQSDALIRLRHMQHDVRALCLQTRAEREGGFKIDTPFRDPEGEPDGGVAVHGFTEAARSAYLREWRAHFEQVATDCKRHDIPLLQAAVETPMVNVLRGWLREAGPKARGV